MAELRDIFSSFENVTTIEDGSVLAGQRPDKTFFNIDWENAQILLKGDTGNKGWSPVFAIVADDDRRVFQISGWVGGEGTKPATGDYVGSSGLVADIADAVDIRGAQGLKGDKGLNNRGEWSAGEYNADDLVSHNGSGWVANTTTTQEPSDGATDWDVLVRKGDPLDPADYTEKTDIADDDRFPQFDSEATLTPKYNLWSTIKSEAPKDLSFHNSNLLFKQFYLPSSIIAYGTPDSIVEANSSGINTTSEAGFDNFDYVYSGLSLISRYSISGLFEFSSSNNDDVYIGLIVDNSNYLEFQIDRANIKIDEVVAGVRTNVFNGDIFGFARTSAIERINIYGSIDRPIAFHGDFLPLERYQPPTFDDPRDFTKISIGSTAGATLHQFILQQ